MSDNYSKYVLLIMFSNNFSCGRRCHCRSQWPRGLRRRYAAARLLRLRVRIPPGGMDICLL